MSKYLYIHKQTINIIIMCYISDTQRVKKLKLCGAFAHIWKDVNKTHFTFHGTVIVMCESCQRQAQLLCRSCFFFFVQSSDFGHIASALTRYQLISVHHSIITCKYCTHSMVGFAINRHVVALFLSDAVLFMYHQDKHLKTYVTDSARR